MSQTPSALGALLALFVFGPSSAAQVVPPQILRWEIQATVFDMADPDGIFPDIRLGDAVRGTLTYDVNGNFTYPAWFGLMSMVIENPRTGQDLKFVKDITGEEGFVVYFDTYPTPTTVNDYIEIVQSVEAPAGFQGEWSVLYAVFEGPPDVLSGGDPFANFNLDDWPIAILSFLDFSDPFEITTYIDAEISVMTRIDTPLAPADFDYDDDVDAVDLYAWTRSFDSKDVHYGDANGDGLTDGADFLAWQRNLTALEMPIDPDGVPEPSALAMSAVAFLLGTGRRSLRLNAAHRRELPRVRETSREIVCVF